MASQPTEQEKKWLADCLVAISQIPANWCLFLKCNYQLIGSKEIIPILVKSEITAKCGWCNKDAVFARFPQATRALCCAECQLKRTKFLTGAYEDTEIFPNLLFKVVYNKCTEQPKFYKIPRELFAMVDFALDNTLDRTKWFYFEQDDTTEVYSIELFRPLRFDLK